jgi:hypothetical protein
VRLRSPGTVPNLDSESPAPQAACADTPWTCANVTHPA